MVAEQVARPSSKVPSHPGFPLPMNRPNSARFWSVAALCRFRRRLVIQSGTGLPRSKTLARRRSGGGEGWGEGEAGAQPQSQAGQMRASAWFVFTNLCLVLLLALAAAGCVTKSKARAQARAAFIAGQQEAMMRMQQSQGPSVTVSGEVRNHTVPWIEGMTLPKALAAADYIGKGMPGQIIIVHNGVGRRYELNQALNGAEISLAPGDMIQLVPR
jgi:hypothetical protein